MTSATNQILETRDFLQHKIVAEFYSSVLKEHLIFKGGTMLRVCGFPQYRYSEDLDFDLINISMSDCYATMERILEDISSEIDLVLFLQTGNAIEASSIIWSDDKWGEGSIVLDMSPVRPSIQADTDYRKIQPNYPAINRSSLIRCHSFVQVAASKFNCLSNRFRGRDIYDMNRLISVHGVLTKSWNQYLQTWKTYDKTFPPENIFQRMLTQSDRFLAAWEEDSNAGLIPDGDFSEIMQSLMQAFRVLPQMQGSDKPQKMK